MSRLGYNVVGMGGDVVALVRQKSPAIVVTFKPEPVWRDLQLELPGTLFVFRPPPEFDDEMSWKNGKASAQQWFNRMLPLIEQSGIRTVAGPNEPGLETLGDASALSDFYVHFANLCHAYGIKVGFGSFARGTPKMGYRDAQGNVEVDMVPYLIPGAKACDYHFWHCYGFPEIMTDAYFQFERPFHFAERLPADARRPIEITEFGIDDDKRGGWSLYVTEERYRDMLAEAQARMPALGYDRAAIFTPYGFGKGFDVINAKLVHALVASGPKPLPITPNPAPPAPSPQPQPAPNPQPNPGPAPIKHAMYLPIQVARIFEGFTEVAVPDKRGRWVIGIGHGLTADDPIVTQKQQWTLARAIDVLTNQDAPRVARLIESSVRVELNDFEFSACFDLAFRIGPGSVESQKGWLGSELLVKLNRGDYRGAAQEFLRWNKVRDEQNNLVVHPASDDRAKAERVIFLMGTVL